MFCDRGTPVALRVLRNASETESRSKHMKNIALLTLLALVGGSLWTSAQDTQSPRHRADRPSLSSRPKIFHRDAAPRPDRPDRPEQPDGSDRPEFGQNLPEEVQDLIKQFQEAREAYLQQHQELMKQAREASDQERAEIREQLRENMQAWRDQQKEFRDQLRERVQEVREQLHPDLRDVVDGAKEDSDRRRSR
jgi:ElaB/YqjD/DUF883 family membrane-anchored ribosome-binding protein